VSKNIKTSVILYIQIDLNVNVCRKPYSIANVQLIVPCTHEKYCWTLIDFLNDFTVSDPNNRPENNHGVAISLYFVCGGEAG